MAFLIDDNTLVFLKLCVDSLCFCCRLCAQTHWVFVVKCGVLQNTSKQSVTVENDIYLLRLAGSHTVHDLHLNMIVMIYNMIMSHNNESSWLTDYINKGWMNMRDRFHRMALPPTVVSFFQPCFLYKWRSYLSSIPAFCSVKAQSDVDSSYLSLALCGSDLLDSSCGWKRWTFSKLNVINLVFFILCHQHNPNYSLSSFLCLFFCSTSQRFSK